MRNGLTLVLFVISMFPQTSSRAQQPLSQSPTAPSTADVALATEHFPDRDNVRIVCWSIREDIGPVSEIVVFETDAEGRAWPLWHSAIDISYSPKIRFLPGATLHGLAVALVERQNGAASSELDVIGKFNGHIARLQRFEGSEFDIQPIQGATLPFLIVHNDVDVLDVPEIYRWNSVRFVRDSAAHPDFYRQILAEDRKTLPLDSAAIVLINLARIAVLASDQAAARQILEGARSSELSKGALANAETLRLVSQALGAILVKEHRVP